MAPTTTKGKAEKIGQENARDLLPREKFGNTFDEKHLAMMEEIIEIMDYFGKLPDESINDYVELTLNQQVESVTDFLQNVASFNFNLSNPANELKNLKTRLVNAYRGVSAALYPLRMQIDLRHLEPWLKETQAKLSEIQDQAHGFQSSASELDTLKTNVEAAYEKAQDFLQKIGVESYSTTFKLQADEHETAAAKWLRMTSLFAVLALVGIIGATDYTMREYTSLNAAQSVNLATSKLLFFTILVGGVLWAAKMYSTHRHNYIVNKHRHNALAAMEVFAKAAHDEATKNTVLLQVTSCIFSPQASGYKGDEDTKGGPQIVEIFKSLASDPQK